MREKLVNTTALENLWKSVANELGLKMDFSEKEFHGATECIVLDDKLKEIMLGLGEKVLKRDLTGYDKFGVAELEKEEKEQLLKEVERFKQERTSGKNKSSKSLINLSK